MEHTLPDQGITTTFVDPEVEGAVEAAIQENTKAIFIESIGNPNANLVDIQEIADIAHRYHIVLVVDSTFATPYLLRPFEYGADIVVHSATKFIGGHGTALGGVIIESGNFDWNASGKYPQLTEPDPSYHGVRFYEAAGAAAFVTRIRADGAAPCIFIFAGAGDIVSPGGAPCGEYGEGRRISAGTPKSIESESSVRAEQSIS